MSRRCVHCGRHFGSDVDKKYVCCDQPVRVKGSATRLSKAAEQTQFIRSSRQQCIRCEHWGERDGSVGCLLCPGRPCDIDIYHIRGFGCFDDPPQYKPCSVAGWQEFTQPSLDDHCVAVTALSRLPHHRNRQSICLDSWKAFGLSIIAVNRSEEIAELRSVYPQVDQWIQCDSPLTDYTWHTQRINDLVNVATQLERTILLINSDIEIYGDQSKIIEPLERGEQVVGIRWNYPEGKIKTAKREGWGLDAFSFTPDQAQQLPDLPLRIGRPMWDYWIPTHSRAIGQPMRFIGDPLFYHEAHKVHWSNDDWKMGARWVGEHYGTEPGHYRRGFRETLPVSPRENATVDRDFEPRPIAVLTSPRTGSNLLVDSLATHPHARSGGEWFNRYVTPAVKRNQAKGIDHCNVVKVFSANRLQDGFDRIVDRSFCIYLYRRDRVAQLASWQRACQTGQWTREAAGPKMPFPPDAEQQINDAETHLRPLADLVICHEDMIKNWDATIERILHAAGWDPAPLPMAHMKL